MIEETAVKPKSHKIVLLLALSFLIPFVFLVLAFALLGVHPFGDAQILVVDGWHQYFPFLKELQYKLQSGGSLLYSWNSGMGTNFLSLMSYYTASPLNLLVGLFPQDALRDVYTLLLTIRIGFAGFSCAYFLHKVFHKDDWTLPCFSLMYAFCALIGGYFWNVMWMDAVAILPLVMLGVLSIVREGKFRLYTLTLAVAIISNYYIGYMVCLFTVIFFMICAIGCKLNVKTFFLRLGQIALFSVLAILMTAFLTLPAYFALQNSYSTGVAFNRAISWKTGLTELISRLAAFTPPSTKTEPPNLYCGLLPVMMLAVYLRQKTFSIRERIAVGVSVVFLLASCSLNLLDFIWHGFHFTNMVPYRFTFVLAFLLIIVMYRTYSAMERFSRADLVAMAVVALIVIASAVIEGAAVATVIANIVLAALFCTAFALFRTGKLNRQMLTMALCGIVTVEMCSFIIIATRTVGTSAYSTYMTKETSVTQALTGIGMYDREKGFFRVETENARTLNDGTLYNYRSLSQFSSSANVNVSLLLYRFGVPAGDSANRYYYKISPPVTNMFFNLKYYIARDKRCADDYFFSSRPIEGIEDADVLPYEFHAYLPLGFVVDEALGELEIPVDTLTPFEAQSQFFSAATGIEEPVYTPVDIIHVLHKNLKVLRSSYGNYNYTVIDPDSDEACQFKFNYEIPYDAPMYVYTKFPDSTKAKVGDFSYPLGRYAYAFPIGFRKQGEIVPVFCDLPTKKNGNAKIYVSALNTDVFRRGYEKLSQQPLEITSFTDTSIDGTISVTEDGLFYTSIPYEKGWTLYIDGVETEITPVMNALVAAPITAGDHEIALRYCPQGFRLGTALSLGALVIFVILALVLRPKKPVEAEPLESNTTLESNTAEEN